MSRLINHGIVEVASLTPMSIRMGDPKYNVDQMLELIHEVNKENKKGNHQTRVVVYPELSVTGYNCGELFNQSALIDSAEDEIMRFAQASNSPYNPLIIIGAPVRKDNQLFNCAVIIFKGEILGIVPKTYLPNYTVLYEARYFHSSVNRLSDSIQYGSKEVPFTPNLIFEDLTSGAAVSAELCEDLWMPLAPSSYHCLHGANIVGNLSSSNQNFGKTTYREELMRIHSSINVCGYIYTCATFEESTTDSVFAGHNIVVSNGTITGDTKYMENKGITYGEVDIEDIQNVRIKSNTYMGVPDKQTYYKIPYKSFELVSKTFYSNTDISVLPFIPTDSKKDFNKVFDLQFVGLAQRLKKADCHQVVVDMHRVDSGILALFATIEAFKWCEFDISGIQFMFCGNHWTEELRQRVLETTRSLKVSQCMKESEICPNSHISDETMTDIANNKSKDHLSKSYLYEVNGSIPNTVIFGLIHDYLSRNEMSYSADLVENILEETDIMVDFALWHMLKNGFGPHKIFDMFVNAIQIQRGVVLSSDHKKTILDELKMFYQNFFTAQLDRKRPDTVKIYSASITQNDWRMPADASAQVWLRQLDVIEIL